MPITATGPHQPLNVTLRTQCRITWMLVVVMLSNAMFPIAAMAGDPPIPGMVLMCTSNGYEWVKVGASRDIVSSAEDSHCLMCLNNANDFSALESQVVVLNAIRQQFDADIKSAFILTPVDAYLPAVRAPPFFSYS